MTTENLPVGGRSPAGGRRSSWWLPGTGFRCAVWLALTVCGLWLTQPVGAASDAARPRPNVLLILADDLGFADLGCYGSEIETPHLDRLAAGGLRFTQFYNAARCCPTRAALLTGRYPHQVGIGHMLGDWGHPGYREHLADSAVTLGELLHQAGYRCYHLGKWHVGGFRPGDERNHPLGRGFDRAFGTAGGGSFFRPEPLYLDRQPVDPGSQHYFTDALSDYAARFLDEHAREHAEQPFFLHLCFTAPHFPLHAKPADIAKYRGRYRQGWDVVRQERFDRQQSLGISRPEWRLSPRHPAAQPWEAVAEADRDDWDLRMAVYAAMIDCLDQGIGRVLAAIDRQGATHNTLVLFLSDNGASAEALDSWPNPARGHRPGAAVGTADSHRCLEVGWASVANTPFRGHKMQTHEGGIATPLVAYWPAGIESPGRLTHQVGHVIDLLPTLLEVTGAVYPPQVPGETATPPEGRSLATVLAGGELGPRQLAWEHEGNRAIRDGDWKLVARYQTPWELYDLRADRTETQNLSRIYPVRVAEMAAAWQAWADRVGVVPWSQLPGSQYRPSRNYRRESEPVSEKQN